MLYFGRKNVKSLTTFFLFENTYGLSNDDLLYLIFLLGKLSYGLGHYN
jgi:hypothetical protein